MSTVPSERIHPTAILGPDVELADDTVVGPYAVLDGKIKVGPGCIIDQGARLIGTITLGKNNRIGAYSVVGEKPQHLKYADEPTSVEMGDNNIIREFVTIHRGTTHSWRTRIGNGNFFMATSHVAHDCIVGNNCVFANGALLAGHCTVADNVVLSGHAALHQFCKIGRIGMISGVSASSKDVPPFLIVQGFNNILGVNVVGMRRAGVPTPHIDAVRRAYFLMFKMGLTVTQGADRMLAEHGDIPEVQELANFIRSAGRGIMLREFKDAA
jgi:UDP-N-acetylglucosamine acyltransferase